MSRALPQPFPWHAIDSTTRGEVSAAAAVRRWVARFARVDELASTMRALVGLDVALRVQRTRALVEARAPDDAVAVMLAPAEAPEVRRAVVVAADRALAAAVVARALQRAAPAVVLGASPVGAALVGAFAAVVAAVVRRAHAGTASRVLAAGPAPVLEADLARACPDAVVTTLTVLLGDDAFAARVVVSPETALSAPHAPWRTAALMALGGMPLGLPIVACGVTVTAADVAALRVGDVFLPGHWRLTCAGAGPGAGALAGPVLLAAPDSDRGVTARLVEDGSLVLGGDGEPLVTAGTDMAQQEDENALVAAVGEVPVLVKVEIGEARMTARQWAALDRGDVVTLGKRVGEPVVLRVGGVAVARGELVVVDGEVGVRVVERVAGGAASE
jgi:flagellar motor switch/type III secretory pathway protein FliN